MKNIIKKAISLLDTKERKQLWGIGFLMLVGGIMESVGVSLVLPVISVMIEIDNWADSLCAHLICSLFHITSFTTYLVTLILILIIVFIIKNLFLLFEYYVQFSFVAKCRFRMQHILIKKFMCKPYSYYLHSTTGEILRIIVDDSSQAYNVITQFLIIATESIVSMALAISFFVINPSLAAYVMLILLIETIILVKLIKPIMSKYGFENRKELANANKWILQAISGIKNIKVANCETYFEKNYAMHASEVARLDAKSQTMNNSPKLFIEAITVSGVLGILLWLVLSGAEVSSLMPALSAFAVAAMRLLPSVNRINVAISLIPYLETGLNNVANIAMDSEQEEIIDSSVNKNEFLFKDNIIFQNITFSYEGGERNVLSGASFKIKKGESIGIVGVSGAGKTTVVDIILGLLRPQVGEVLVDGKNIFEDIGGWRSSLAYIPQNIFLLDGTIRENVAFGINEDDIDESAVTEAITDAQLGEFVASLPDGLDTQVGEAGIRLSGGQRQRIGIARALYGKPELLIFDEATSALDNETEAAVMNAIEHLKGRKTLIIVAHRLSTISNCDIVYRVENGKISSV